MICTTTLLLAPKLSWICIECSLFQLDFLWCLLSYNRMSVNAFWSLFCYSVASTACSEAEKQAYELLSLYTNNCFESPGAMKKTFALHLFFHRFLSKYYCRFFSTSPLHRNICTCCCCKMIIGKVAHLVGMLVFDSARSTTSFFDSLKTILKPCFLEAEP